MRYRGAVRIREPRREGQELVFVLAEDSLPSTHPARILWTALGDFDLSAFVEDAKAVEGTVGRRVYSPRMMLTLWGYALWNGVVHAREIARLIHRDMTYRWIVADVDVGRTRLSDFLVSHRDAMVGLLADLLGALIDAQLLFLPNHQLAQDGTKVRADAGVGSFRTAAGLAECHVQAELHLKAVLAQLDDPPLRGREQEARERGAMDVLDRIQAATKAAAAVQAQRDACKDKHRKETPAKASTTDPDARLMRMADGARLPAHNLQFATVGDPAGGPIAIVGVRVTDQGNDKGSLLPMRATVTELTGVTPTTVLADPDPVTLDDLRRATAEDYTIVSRVPKTWKFEGPGQDALSQAWMTRMETPEAKADYRGRKALAERPNAILKTTFGVDRLPVRGHDRVECFAWFVALMLTLHEFRHHWVN
jgi:transposase